MKTINEQIEEIIISTVGVGLEGEYPYKIKLTNVDQAAKEIIALKQQAEKTPAQELSNNRQQSESSANNLKTAEEILKNVLNDVYTKAGVPSGSHTVTKEDALNAMEEYAAQLKEQEITDEDIEKWARKRYEEWLIMANEDHRSHSWEELLLIGAKAHRDNLIKKGE